MSEADETTECLWRHDSDGTWETSCGEAWTFIDGGPSENNARFCQGCGRPITTERAYNPNKERLLALPDAEKVARFDAMARATYSHVDGRDLLYELHPRQQLDIKRRVDGRETWFEGDWLTNLFFARNGDRRYFGE